MSAMFHGQAMGSLLKPPGCIQWPSRFFCADEIDLIDFNRLFFEYDLGQTLDLRFGYFNIL